MSSRPDQRSPMPSSSLIASVAWSRPIMPGTTPSTPATEQPGASSGGGGVGIEAAVARAVERLEDRQLALEAEHRRVDDRDAGAHRGVVERVARLEACPCRRGSRRSPR